MAIYLLGLSEILEPTSAPRSRQDREERRTHPHLRPGGALSIRRARPTDPVQGRSTAFAQGAYRARMVPRFMVVPASYVVLGTGLTLRRPYRAR